MKSALACSPGVGRDDRDAAPADENFNGDVVRALLLRQPDLDIVRVQDVGLAGIADPDILAWAAMK